MYNSIFKSEKVNDFVSAETFPRLRVLGKSIYRGPHLYSQTPMICLKVDLGVLESWPTDKIPDFAERLLHLLPGLHEHGCSYGESGGFCKRMDEGTWLGHVIEHVAIELQIQADMPVSRGKTRSVKGRPGTYNIMYEYKCEKAGLYAGHYALELINTLLPPEIAGFEGLDSLGLDAEKFSSVDLAIKHIALVAALNGLGPTTGAIVEAAKKRAIPFMRLDDQSFVQLGWGKNQRRIRGSITDATSNIAVDNASDKQLTKKLLHAAGVPVPAGDCVSSVEQAIKAAIKIGFPVTVKPLNGNHGRGVTTNITSDRAVQDAFSLAQEYGPDVLVEQHYAGRDYRILMVNERVVAVSERVPAHIIGDGRHSIEALVELLNADPRRGDGHENILSKIIIGPATLKFLERSGFTLKGIPLAGLNVPLCGAANISTGGTAIDRTDEIHPANIVLMERAAQAIGLDIAGIDVVTEDISKPIAEYGGGVLEVNASPGFRMHLHPAEGRARPVGEAAISLLFPKNAPARIPVIAVTGTNGKSTTTRMIAHILRHTGKRVGFTSTSGIYINDHLLWRGDASGPQSARTLLCDKTIDVAVLETARGGLIREGLGVDYCDVGAVLNVTADHLGIAGIETVEDMAEVKSVITESVHGDGVSVLNFDDPLTRDMARNAGGRVCYFSMQGGFKMDEALRKHINEAGMAVVKESWPEQGKIVIHKDGQRIPLMDADKIPATLGGIVDFNIENSLAAVAIAVGMNIETGNIRGALSTFASSFEKNPGRLNIYDEHGFRVIMDYAHNPAALSAFLDMIEKMRPHYNNLIGCFSIPGDRQEKDIREMGRIAARSLDFIVFRESPDRRGRAEGEVLRLLKEGAVEAGFPEINITCIDTEEEAADVCLSMAAPGDLVILTPSDVEGTWQRIISFKPTFAIIPAPPIFGTVDLYA